MDLCITAEEPFAYEPPKTKPFTPVSPPLTRAETRNTSTSGLSAYPTSLPSIIGASELDFDLIIHDPNNNDSSLTYPWDCPHTPLRIALDTSRVHLLNLLREQLPLPESKKSRRARSTCRPKLIAATMYWTFRGSILPIGLSDKDWHYHHPITKTDIMARTELEWFLLKEMMASSGGALKCYIAIRGEILPTKKTTGWWFGGTA
ncbi:hypothetical protein FVEN_g444 [Fusarium venenatum]|uniref:Uncharacterized protein n=1 Tax=Fusarium venenatum TaxID=56646 RepID=A0A2L2SYA7_9HYPO|nr:uncharacterized protein FVRRES_07430 [Fusarium venenatum]KAG8361889.1 hypothetical protein FVEN_g444 [Fusarium venenatum]CEI62994.1 unnamed protein product [Fusarium venenatum]